MPGQSAANLAVESLQLPDLRIAIRTNRVSFPVPVPVFARQYCAETQWRMAELYLVHGWSPLQLSERYSISCTRVRQSLRSWVHRARTLGYLQPIPAETENSPEAGAHLR